MRNSEKEGGEVSVVKLLKRISNAEFNSATLRTILGLYYRNGRFYRLPFGPLRGLQMYYDRSINFHVILGLWDTGPLRTLRKVLVATANLEDYPVIVDVGANVGYTSLFFAKTLGSNAKIFSFEAVPATAEILRKNITRNAVNNIEIVPLACSNSVGTVDFFVAKHHHCSSLVKAWARPETSEDRLTVPSTTLDNFFLSGSEKKGPALIKVDIEGGGIYALAGMKECVRKFRPLFWIESHTPEEDGAISNLIIENGYQAFRLQTMSLVRKPTATHPDPEGVWGTLLAYPPEKARAIDAVLGIAGRDQSLKRAV